MSHLPSAFFTPADTRSRAAARPDEVVDRWVALLMLPLRGVLGWIFFAAAWRRLVLAPDKHDMDSPGWLGHKLTTFVPHATEPVHFVLEYLAREPVLMNYATWVFTAAELAVGLLLFAGLATRLTALGSLALGVGLMHTSGWLGPTCLSEWHTASLLVVTSVLLALTGAGSLSMDRVLETRWPALAQHRLWRAVAGRIPINRMPRRRTIVALAALLTLYVMGMNQHFHGGVWGPLHNHSVRPGLVIGAPTVSGDGAHVAFSVYRDRGPETWGTHVIAARLIDAAGTPVAVWSADELRDLRPDQIDNVYINRVRTGPHALEVPLGARATLVLPLNRPLDASIVADTSRGWTVELEEIGGLSFRSP